MRTSSALGLAMALLSAAGNSLAADAARPSPEMASLTRALAGTWAVEDIFAPLGDNQDSISTPKGGRGHGVQVWRSGPGGFTFMEEEHNYTPAGEVFIVGYTWWDATRKRFGGMECNSQWPKGCDVASAISLVDLSWDGRRFVVDIRSETDPKKLVWHEVFSDITPTSFLQTADVAMPDGSMKRWLTIHARRIGRAPAR